MWCLTRNGFIIFVFSMPTNRTKAKKGTSPSILAFFSKRPRRERDVLEANLRRSGLRIRWDVPGDGACWFHSILDQCNKLDIEIPGVEPAVHAAISKEIQESRAMQLREAVLQFFENLVS